MYNGSILIVDDEVSYLDLLRGLLNDEGYNDIITEKNPLKVMDIIERQNVDIILCDIYMPEISGMELLDQIYQKHPRIPVIMVTAVDDIKIALEAIDRGAYEFITKPPDIDRLFLTIKRALEKRLFDLERKALLSIRETNEKKWHDNFSDIITKSAAMYKVFELLEIFAPTDETILITGETGTGKDLIAKKIHQLSPRRNKPFVIVNLASISPTLFESELFGHEKGAFTGAVNGKIGYFESSDGGTIFLDEIGELPKELQGKLLRAIQYNEIHRIGSSQPMKLNTRIIAATNKDLLDAIQTNDFRSDLFYRLTRGFVNLPPLRERKEDILLLANYFLTTGNLIYKKNIHGFTDKIINKLYEYYFPGNVRELENIVMNAVAKTSDHSFINEVELQPILPQLQPSHITNNLLTIDEIVTNHILSVLKHTGNNIVKAASILGVSERTLQRKLKEIKN